MASAIWAPAHPPFASLGTVACYIKRPNAPEKVLLLDIPRVSVHDTFLAKVNPALCWPANPESAPISRD